MKTINLTIPLPNGAKYLSFPVDMDKLMAIYSAYRFNKHSSAHSLVQSFLGRKLELDEMATAQAVDDIAMVRELLADAVDLNAHRITEASAHVPSKGPRAPMTSNPKGGR